MPYHGGAAARKGAAGVGRLFGLGLAVVIGCVAASLVRPSSATAAGPAACGPDGGETVGITAVAADWSLVLADGRLVRLAGIDPVEGTALHPALAEEARAGLSGWLAGRAARLVSLGSGTDRWGRVGGLVFAADDTPARARGGPGPAGLSVALALVDAGLARGRPEADAAACWPAILAAEGTARGARLGLWGDPAYAVHRPGDASALTAALGTMVLVEGRVRRIGHGRTRLFVGLGEAGAETTFSLGKRDLFILDQLGLNETMLVGATLRIRGDLEDRRGFSIDVTDAGQIEVLGRATTAGPGTGR